MARRRSISETACASARSLFRNFSRAGVKAKRSLTSMRVPKAAAAGRTAPLTPASTTRPTPCAASRCRVVIASLATEPIEGSASPRKPSERMAKRSPSGSFEVAWRSTASARSSGLMPAPSSTTRMSSRPPAAMVTAMARAPASIAFSTSSFTAAAGRSITSPAAMRSTRTGSRRRTVMLARRGARLRPARPGGRRPGPAVCPRRTGAARRAGHRPA